MENAGAENAATAKMALPPKPMFGIIPDFEYPSDAPDNRPPLTEREKYMLSLHEAFDTSAHIRNVFQAALQQAGNGEPHYGEGWGAFGERFAANEGDKITGSLLTYGVLPSLLHEDPRYFRRGTGSAMARTWYAIDRTFVTRRDDGSSGFNNSEVFGEMVSASISVLYYPRQDRTAAEALTNWLVNLGGNSGYNLLTEFYPDLMRGLFGRHKPQIARAAN